MGIMLRAVSMALRAGAAQAQALVDHVGRLAAHIRDSHWPESRRGLQAAPCKPGAACDVGRRSKALPIAAVAARAGVLAA